METVRIITLHLAYGGIEKAVCQMASMFAEKYDVEIISVYDMPDAPAFPIDERVRVRYFSTRYRTVTSGATAPAGRTFSALRARA